MRKFGIVVGSLIVAVAAIWFFLPAFVGVTINLTCREPINESCQMRMRSLGHAYAAKGDLATALGWYEQAARSGDRIAMFHAGWAHSSLAIEELRRYFEKAFSTKALSIDVYVPDRNPHDEAALAWYKQAAEAGFAPAMTNLAQMYRYGIPGGEPNPHSTFGWNLKAAELGNPIAQLNLAADYERGFGTRPNHMLAEHWANVPMENEDPADLAEPTFSRTWPIKGGKDYKGDEMIDGFVGFGPSLPPNWDYERIRKRVLGK